MERLKRYGHVMKSEEENIVRRVPFAELPGKRRREWRAYFRWKEARRRGKILAGVRKDYVTNWVEWRKNSYTGNPRRQDRPGMKTNCCCLSSFHEKCVVLMEI